MYTDNHVFLILYMHRRGLLPFLVLAAAAGTATGIILQKRK